MGEYADGADAAIAASQGDWAGAATSAAAMIPFIGWGAGAKRLADLSQLAAKTCKRNSFVAGAAVLLASGLTKAIEDIEVGDKVLATDPATGITEPREVTALIVGEGDKNLVDITVDTDGDAGDKTGTLIATEGHPFWVENRHQWVQAEQLRLGDTLRSPNQTTVTVDATRRYTQPERVYNLTVDGIHTYYVIAGTTPVLVHNTGPGAGDACGVPLPTQITGQTQRLTNKQATDLANYLGFKPTNYIVRGQKVFTDGKQFIVQDTTSHNGGTWKIANSVDDLNGKTTRTATTDALLNEIGG